MINYFNKSYYKIRIILTFSIITIVLVTVLARVSYVLVKELYLNQISSNVVKTLRLTVSQLDRTYFSYLNSGITTKTTNKYFLNFFNNSTISELYSETFIFNKKLNVIIHSDSSRKTNVLEPRLLLNKSEISNLLIDQTITSLPFKGDDNIWYLWGFYRLSETNWLAVKENATNFEKVENLSNIIWSFGIAGIFISFFLGILVSNSITKPIRKLVAFSKEIGLGNLNTKEPEKMRGELKRLSKALNTMRNNIANNHKEKEMILAQIAHEIRNPLGGIELLTNLINESSTNKIKNKKYTDRILNEISELKKLINSYLNYSKPTIPIIEEVNLNDLFDEIILIFGEELSSNNIVLRKFVNTKNINFDRLHLKNIIVNLIKNSIESIEKNGEIVIESYSKNGIDYISVFDDGNGINDNDISKIFEPFFTTKPNGTGLGLATCKKYCNENYADIFVNVNQLGCKFIISKENRNG